jgi:hypothetical protein
VSEFEDAEETLLGHRPSVDELSNWLSGVEDVYSETERMSEEAELTLETVPACGTFRRQHCELPKLRTILCCCHERSWPTKYKPVKRRMIRMEVESEMCA